MGEVNRAREPRLSREVALEVIRRVARGSANFQAAEGRTDEAVATLSPIVTDITEGRDTLDYVYAETLLETLGSLTNPAQRELVNPGP